MSGVMTAVLARGRTSRFRNTETEGFEAGTDRGLSTVETAGSAFREDRGYGWFGFRDVPLGAADAGTISEVITGPGGIFVIDHVDGEESVVVEGGRLMRADEPADELADKARDAAAVIQAELPPHVRALVQPVLCLDGAKAAFGWSEDVMICSPVTLAPMMNSRPPLVTDTRVNEIAEHLERRYPFEEEPVEEALAQVFDFEAALLGASLTDTLPVEVEDEGVTAVTPVEVAADAEVLVEEAEAPAVVVETEAVPQVTKPKRVAPKRRKEPTTAQKALQLLWLVAALVVALVLGFWMF